ncbi:MAG: 3'-5' exonuclease [Clostridia bacterium]|nr:3'-5' exonuclease [Clostridia bacterium]
MRYVFFDIECADGGKGSICSFGYVITDERFRELESRDIVINPESRFYLVGRAKRPDILLSYTEAEFRKAPKFPSFYAKIKALLEREDQVVVGHSVQDDVNFLCKDCARYGLPPLKFRFADTQSLYSDAFGISGQMGLDRACEEFSIPKPQDVHNSEADARATMFLAKKICETKGIALHDYVKNSRTWGETENFKIFCSYIHPNRTMFCSFLEKVAPKNKREQVLTGKAVSVSMGIEQPRQAQIYHLVQTIVDAGGTYTRVASECDIFVTANAEPGRICKRTKTARDAKRGGKHMEIISLDVFLKRLGISKEEYQNFPLPDIHWM